MLLAACGGGPAQEAASRVTRGGCAASRMACTAGGGTGCMCCSWTRMAKPRTFPRAPKLAGALLQSMHAGCMCEHDDVYRGTLSYTCGCREDAIGAGDTTHCSPVDGCAFALHCIVCACCVLLPEVFAAMGTLCASLLMPHSGWPPHGGHWSNSFTSCNCKSQYNIELYDNSTCSLWDDTKFINCRNNHSLNDMHVLTHWQPHMPLGHMPRAPATTLSQVNQALSHTTQHLRTGRASSLTTGSHTTAPGGRQ